MGKRAGSAGRPWAALVVGLVATSGLGCASMDIPQAHRGRMFSRTGLLALYTGSDGLSGPVRDPGSHFVGIYNELRTVDCSTKTVTESLDTLTKDGVHFGFDIAIRFSADCTDEGVLNLLNRLSPADGQNISTDQIFVTFIQPAIGEAARELVAPLKANELNDRQGEVASGVKKRFSDMMTQREKKLVIVYEVNVVNFHFPPSLDTANLERASQSLLRDKAIAERERVTAEAETMQVRKQLAQQEAEVATVKIERIGEALAKNPLYLQYDLQLKLPEIYEKAGQRGNLVLAAPSPLNLGWGQGLPGQLPRPASAEPQAPPAVKAPAPKAAPPPKGR
jgi:hypothetical protein